MPVVSTISARAGLPAAVALMVAALLLSGCSSGPSQQSALDLGSGPTAGAATPTPASSPQPLVIITPEVWPTPVGTPFSSVAGARNGTATAIATVTGTLTPAATPRPTIVGTATPTATLVPIAQLPELARSMDDSIAALSQAIAAKDTSRLLQLQSDLLSEADKTERALQVDRSPQADMVRQAILDARAGAAGDSSKLASARQKLRIALGQSGSGGDAAASAVGTQAMASSLQTKLKALDDARQQSRVNDLLKLQQALLQELAQDQKALAGMHSADADKLQSILGDLKSGLSGEDSMLQSANAALQAFSGAAGQTDSATTSADSQAIQSDASNLDSKLSNVRDALSNGGRDQLLQAQRDLLDAISRTENDVTGNNSDQAGKLRDALAMARNGASGDVAKLDGARSKLAELTGNQQSANAQPAGVNGASANSGPTVHASDLPRLADDLSKQVDAYKAAVVKGDRQGMLRMQQGLMNQLNKDDQAVRGISGQQGDQVRSALSDLRNALGGDLNKLNSANASLRLVATSNEPSNPAPLPLEQQQGSPEAQQAARDLLKTVDDVDTTLQSGSASDLARVRQELQRASDATGKLPPADAAALNSAIGSLNEALSGDRSKLEQARSQLKQIIPR